MIRLDSGEAVPVQSIIDGAKYATFIDEAVMFVTQKMKERGDELAESVIEKLKMVDGKHVIENASVEFVSFIEDAYKSIITRDKSTQQVNKITFMPESDKISD